MPIELSRHEQELVASLLEKEIEEIRAELRRTESHDYRDDLRERETVVRGLLAKLRG